MFELKSKLLHEKKVREEGLQDNEMSRSGDMGMLFSSVMSSASVQPAVVLLL